MLYIKRGKESSAAGMNKEPDKNTIDMTQGPLLGKILRFAVPLILMYMLQLAFNATDMLIIGHFRGTSAMAAIGSTMTLNSLVVCIFIGLSVGTNVLMAKYFGAKDSEAMKNTVHTSMAVSVIIGLVLMVLGWLISEPALRLMETPESILPDACLYLNICFGATPFVMVNIFGSAILRAVGDTRRTLYILIVAGVVNVVLNYVFVTQFGMGVDGVAYATAISHAISAILVVLLLMRSRNDCKLELHKMTIRWGTFKDIMLIGIPSGLQAASYAVSNTIIQSAINTFGEDAIAGNTAVLVLESIVYIGTLGFQQATVAFTAQNLGAGHIRRIQRIIVYTALLAMSASFLFGWIFYLNADFFISLFSSGFQADPEVIRYGKCRMIFVFAPYAIMALQDVLGCGIRGLGYSMTAAALVLTGTCLFRILWVAFVFPLNPASMPLLFWTYPISWILTTSASMIVLVVLMRRLMKEKVAAHYSMFAHYTPDIPKGMRCLDAAK